MNATTGNKQASVAVEHLLLAIPLLCIVVAQVRVVDGHK